MTCQRILEINVAAFLADPRASEHRSFLEHYPTCADCSTELEDWTRLERVVREVTTSTHPAGAKLLAYRRAPESLTGAQRDEVAAHVASCAPCRNAVDIVVGVDVAHLTAQTASEGRRETAGQDASLVERLRGLLSLPAPAWVAAALVLLALAAGLPWILGDTRPPAPTVAHREAPVPPEPARPAIPRPAQTPEEYAERAAPGEQDTVQPPQAPAPASERPSRQATVAQTPPEAPMPAPTSPRPSRQATVAETPPQAPPEELPAPQPEKPAPLREEPFLIASLGAEPVRFLPRVGLPSGRLSGTPRGTAVAASEPLALVPERVGLTLEAQPSLYWLLLEPSAAGVRVDLSDVDRMEPVFSTTLPGPLEAGVQVLHLADHAVALSPERHYQWALGSAGADDPTSGGIVKRVRPEADLQAALEQAAPADRLRVLAARGLWYDALDLLSRSIAAQPGDARLREARAQLFDQQGLDAAAAWDRSGR